MNLDPQIAPATVQSLADRFYSEVRDIRHDLHAHPELSFQEYRTAAKVAEILESKGIEVHKGIANTGLVALIKGRRPESETIALRADLDALPIQEKNDVPYRSTNEGVMHACGHDVHTSCLLGAAFILNDLKDQFTGTVKLIFQPGEEKLPGGASLMIAEGVLDDPEPSLIFAQHVYPQLPAGTVGFGNGTYMASADEIYITVKGKGGHAAMPHLLKDPITAAAQIITGLQRLVSRESAPHNPRIISIGKVIANGATNVIPDEVKMEGTLRAMDEEWRALMHKRIPELVRSMSKAFDVEADVEVIKGYPCLINNDKATDIARNAASEYLGAEQVVPLNPVMGGEDFAYYSQKMPACFYRLGVANEALGINSSIHSSSFDIDEEALRTGSGLFAWIAITALGSN